MFKYGTLPLIEELVRSFEAASIAREDWRHAEHLVVALYYCANLGPEDSHAKMRAGIRNLLSNGFGIGPDEEDPYHETLTAFWMLAVGHFLARHSGKPIGEIAEKLVGTLDKDYPLRFYVRERLFSGEARKTFISPEHPFPWAEETACDSYS